MDRVSADTESGIIRVTKDFARGLVDSGLEKPLNAFVDLSSHVTGLKLPNLDIVNDPTEGTVATTVGRLAGTAIDIFLLSKVLGAGLTHIGAPQAGMAANALRLGATGFTYGSLFKPTDPTAPNFLVGRLKNGIVEGGTWSVIGMTGEGLMKTGIFAPAPVRSLFGDIALGAIGGTAGGFTHASLNAAVGNRRLSQDDWVRDALQYAAMGAIFGGLSHVGKVVVNEIGSHRTTLPSKFRSGLGDSVVIKRNMAGEAIGVKARQGGNEYFTKDPDGSWTRSSHNRGEYEIFKVRLAQGSKGELVHVDTLPVESTGHYLQRTKIYQPGGYSLKETIVTTVPDITKADAAQSTFFVNGHYKDHVIVNFPNQRAFGFEELTVKKALDAVKGAFKSAK